MNPRAGFPTYAHSRAPRPAKLLLQKWQRSFFRYSVYAPAAGSLNGGEGGIRTHGTLLCSTVFKTASLNHSDTSPRSCGLGALIMITYPSVAVNIIAKISHRKTSSIFLGKYAQTVLFANNHPPANELFPEPEDSSRAGGFLITKKQAPGRRLFSYKLKLFRIIHRDNFRIGFWPASQQLPSALSRTRWTRLRQPQPRSYRRTSDVFSSWESTPKEADPSG